MELNLRSTVSRSVCIGVGPPFEAHDQILHFLYSDIYLFLYVGRPLWREDGSVSCSAHCRHQVPQNLRPNLTVSFEIGFPFCRLLRLERLRLSYYNPPQGAWLGPEWSGVLFAIDGPSAGLSWCRSTLWSPWPDFTCSLVWHVLASSCRAPSLTRGQICILQCTSLTGQSREGLTTIYYCLIWDWVPFSSPLTAHRVMVEAFWLVPIWN
jgi:hypothetical protein